jgi:hypothetical protein
MPVSRTDLETLIEKVSRTPGWEVKNHPSRWRVTNSEGGGPLFINHRPPKGNTLKAILDDLVALGWDENAAEARDEADRKARIEADRKANEVKMLEAQRKMQAAQLEELRKALEEQGRNDSELKRRRDDALMLPGGVSKEVVEIDASFARDLLGYNNFFDDRGELDPTKFVNRPLDPALVIEFRNAMLRGEWTQSHQGLAFDHDMQLIDGQHRLVAVIEANKIKPGISFITEITYNLDPRVFAVVDSGKRRTTADVLALHRVTNRLVSAAAVKLLHLFYNVPFSQWSRYRMTNTQTLELYPKFDVVDGEPGRLAEAVKVGSRLSKVITTPSASAAGYYITKAAYPAADPEEFVFGLQTGVSLDPGDPRLAYRRFNERLRSQRRRTTSNVEQLALYIKAWNAWVDGSPVHQLVWRSNEPFPQPIHQGKSADYPEREDSQE